MYQIRLAENRDLPEILQIYADARVFMAKTGNPNQWGNHHPPRAMLEADILNQKLYVAVKNDKVEGVFFFTLDPDPTYVKIYDGAWHSDGQYGTIHRIASGGGKGIFPDVLEFCLKACSWCASLPWVTAQIREKPIAASRWKSCIGATEKRRTGSCAA